MRRILNGNKHKIFLIILIILTLSFISHSQSDPCQGGRPQPNLKICNISCILEEEKPLNNIPILVHYLVNCTGKDMGGNPRIIFHFNDTLGLHGRPIVSFPDKNNHIARNHTIINKGGSKKDLIIALRDSECFNEVHLTEIFLNIFIPWQSSSKSFDLMHSSFLELDAQIDNKTRMPCILKILSRPTISDFREVNSTTKARPGDNLTFAFYLADNDSKAVNVSLWENDNFIQNHEYSIVQGNVDDYQFSYQVNNTEGNYRIYAVAVDGNGLNSTSDVWNLAISNLSASNPAPLNQSPALNSTSNRTPHEPTQPMNTSPSNDIKAVSLFLLFFLMISMIGLNVVDTSYLNSLKYALIVIILIISLYLPLDFSIFVFKVLIYLLCLWILNFKFLFIEQNELRQTLYISITNATMFFTFLLITLTNTNEYISREYVFLVYYTIIISFLGYIFLSMKQLKASSGTIKFNIQQLCHLSGSMLIISVLGLITEISWLAEPSSELIKYIMYFAQDYSILLLCPLLLILIKFKLDGT